MTRSHVWAITPGLVLLTALPALMFGGAAYGQDSTRAWPAPVVMEEATVRGKVAVLETRREDRQVVADLRIEVWTVPEGSENDPSGKAKRIHETATDTDGFFDLPELAIGHYRLVVGQLNLKLIVIKRDPSHSATEAKRLLILLPKESLG